jgi:hypothetical protein
MSNCVAGLGGGMPLGAVTERGVESYNHLAHHGNDDAFGPGHQAIPGPHHPSPCSFPDIQGGAHRGGRHDHCVAAGSAQERYR